MEEQLVKHQGFMPWQEQGVIFVWITKIVIFLLYLSVERLMTSCNVYPGKDASSLPGSLKGWSCSWNEVSVVAQAAFKLTGKAWEGHKGYRRIHLMEITNSIYSRYYFNKEFLHTFTVFKICNSINVYHSCLCVCSWHAFYDSLLAERVNVRFHFEFLAPVMSIIHMNNQSCSVFLTEAVLLCLYRWIFIRSEKETNFLVYW